MTLINDRYYISSSLQFNKSTLFSFTTTTNIHKIFSFSLCGERINRMKWSENPILILSSTTNYSIREIFLYLRFSYSEKPRTNVVEPESQYLSNRDNSCSLFFSSSLLIFWLLLFPIFLRLIVFLFLLFISSFFFSFSPSPTIYFFLLRHHFPLFSLSFLYPFQIRGLNHMSVIFHDFRNKWTSWAIWLQWN